MYIIDIMLDKTMQNLLLYNNIVIIRSENYGRMFNKTSIVIFNQEYALQ